MNENSKNNLGVTAMEAQLPSANSVCCYSLNLFGITVPIQDDLESCVAKKLGMVVLSQRHDLESYVDSLLESEKAHHHPNVFHLIKSFLFSQKNQTGLHPKCHAVNTPTPQYPKQSQSVGLNVEYAKFCLARAIDGKCTVEEAYERIRLYGWINFN